jgi:hypothetical protein
MPKNYWWPNTISSQYILVQNFQVKIAVLGPALGFSTAEINQAVDLCRSFIEPTAFVDQWKSSMKAAIKWRNEIIKGKAIGQPVGPPPAVPSMAVGNYPIGFWKQFQSLRDRIIASPAYTPQIGTDLGIIGSTSTPLAPSNFTPELKATPVDGYRIKITGSMKGMDAVKIEYAPQDGNFTTVAFLTRTPGTFRITPADPSRPEAGQLRCIFIHNNEPYGNYSANYPVIVS